MGKIVSRAKIIIKSMPIFTNNLLCSNNSKVDNE